MSLCECVAVICDSTIKPTKSARLAVRVVFANCVWLSTVSEKLYVYFLKLVVGGLFVSK